MEYVTESRLATIGEGEGWSIELYLMAYPDTYKPFYVLGLWDKRENRIKKSISFAPEDIRRLRDVLNEYIRG